MLRQLNREVMSMYSMLRVDSQSREESQDWFGALAMTK